MNVAPHSLTVNLEYFISFHNQNMEDIVGDKEVFRKMMGAYGLGIGKECSEVQSCNDKKIKKELSINLK